MKPLSALIPLLAVLLSACTSFSHDGGFDRVASLSQQRLGTSPVLQRGTEPGEAIRQRILALAAQPLSAESAVELALLCNRSLQASYAELGLAEADLVRAARPANPGLSLGRLAGHGSTEIDRGLMFDLLGLLTLNSARELEQGRFEQAQLQAAAETVEVAAAARRAFYEAVAALQLLDYQGRVQQSAEASAQLAQRMQAAGNFSRLAQMREQAFQADASAQMSRARHQARATREALIRALGWEGAPQDLHLPERLPDLPAQPRSLPDAEQAAMDQRLDVQSARQATIASAKALGLTQGSRFINVLELGYQNRSSSGEARADGYQITLELPLFDGGSTRLAQAEATHRQRVHRLAALAQSARSEVREASSAYREAFALAARYRDDLVPLRQRIAEEQLLRYNGMLASVFELLADARDQMAVVSGAIEAQRDFWIADSELQLTISGRSPGRAGSFLQRSASSNSSAPAH